MTHIRFLCPECESKLSVPENATACAVPCPNCGKYIRAWGSELLDTAFFCPCCATVLVVDRRGAGMSAYCPQCGGKIQVPAKDLEPPLLVSAPGVPMVAEAKSRKHKTIRLSEEELDFLTGNP